MKFERRFTVASKPVVDQIEWKIVPAQIDRKTAQIADIEVPAHWSQNASNIFSDMYLRKAGVPSETERWSDNDIPGLPQWLMRSKPVPAYDVKYGAETSAKAVFHRLSGAWTYWGWREGFFEDEAAAQTFYDEIYWCLAMQIAVPNSPQFFNTGLHWAYGISGPDSGRWRVDPATGVAEKVSGSYEYPQPHACFLTPTTDDLVNPGGIMDTWVREASIFKGGSGSGVNVSSWRAKGEKLSGGGRASGVMSWLSIGDRSAGAIQSGGTTRRAAKMVILDDDHPELSEFITWKVREEGKAAAMDVGSQVLRNMYKTPQYIDESIIVKTPQPMIDRLENGFEPESLPAEWESEGMRTIDGQNSNNSIRATDKFMVAAQAGAVWNLTARTTGEVVKTVDAGKVWNELCRAAWACADPGLLFHDHINEWNTSAADGVIRTTNPCFTGDTKVWTAYGPKRFDELAKTGANIPVLTELQDGSLAYRDMIKPRMTQNSVEVIEITLKTVVKGSSYSGNISHIRCTPDHIFYMKDGSSKKAKDLKYNDRIESVYRRKVNQRIWGLNSTNGDRVHEHHLACEYRFGRRPHWPNEHGHHGDKNYENNIPDNMEILSAHDHISGHKKGSHLSLEQKQTLSSYASMRTGEKNSFFGKKHTQEVKQKISAFASTRTEESNPFFGKKHSDTARQKMVDAWAIRKKAGANHAVVKITHLTEKEDVYCGTVSETGRFFISLNKDNRDGVLVSNCAEFHHLDGSACNLASLRLTAFLQSNGTIDLDAFEHVSRLWTIILDISISMASFPAKEFAEGAWNFRTLGLGYMDLGGLLMRLALSYDSDEGRALAAGLTALMTGITYCTSAEMAEHLSPFPRWEANAVPFYTVMQKHNSAVHAAAGGTTGLAAACFTNAFTAWNKVLEAKSFRNAQTTLIAPTGTIHLITDCDTSGMEPDFALVKHKQLAGGGSMTIVNQAIPAAAKKMGFSPPEIEKILAHVEAYGNLDEFAFMAPLDRRVFACVAELDPMAHIKMVAAIQPFLSGAASKTVNLPNSATVEDVSNVYRTAWELGIKAISLYRDGSKLTQPLAAAKKKSSTPLADIPAMDKTQIVGTHTSLARGAREYLPTRRKGETQKARVGGQTVHYNVGLYDDGRVGELFLNLSNTGSTLGGFAASLAKMISIALQYGAPAEKVFDALLGVKFEPAGFVEMHADVKQCDSIPDLIARDVLINYLGRDDLSHTLRMVAEGADKEIVALDRRAVAIAKGKPTGETCRECGGILVQDGACKICTECGERIGGCG